MGLHIQNNSKIIDLKKIEKDISKSIAILGCGWLGLSLAKHFIRIGYSVNGTTTTPEKISILKELGINPFLIKLDPEITGETFDAFSSPETLIINIPPSLRKNPPGYHLNQVRSICRHLQDELKNIIYISSTSVYPENQEEVTEESPVDEAHELFQAESILRRHFKERLTILRCGGLMGYERVPGKYFAGKKELPEGNNPVNYVHRDDVIRIIYEITAVGAFGDLFNVVSPQHPLKKEVATKTAKDFNLAPPHFKVEKAWDYKIVNSEKIMKRLDYKFAFPDPIDFYYDYKP